MCPNKVESTALDSKLLLIKTNTPEEHKHIAHLTQNQKKSKLLFLELLANHPHSKSSHVFCNKAFPCSVEPSLLYMMVKRLIGFSQRPIYIWRDGVDQIIVRPHTPFCFFPMQKLGLKLLTNCNINIIVQINYEDRVQGRSKAIRSSLKNQVRGAFPMLF